MDKGRAHPHRALRQAHRPLAATAAPAGRARPALPGPRRPGHTLPLLRRRTDARRRPHPPRPPDGAHRWTSSRTSSRPPAAATCTSYLQRQRETVARAARGDRAACCGCSTAELERGESLLQLRGRAQGGAGRPRGERGRLRPALPPARPLGARGGPAARRRHGPWSTSRATATSRTAPDHPVSHRPGAGRRVQLRGLLPGRTAAAPGTAGVDLQGAARRPASPSPPSRGPYDTIWNAHVELHAWVAEHGYARRDPCARPAWSTDDDTDDPRDWVTELRAGRRCARGALPLDLPPWETCILPGTAGDQGGMVHEVQGLARGAAHAAGGSAPPPGGGRGQATSLPTPSSRTATSTR